MRRLVAIDLCSLSEEKDEFLMEISRAISAELRRRDDEKFKSGDYPDMNEKELELLKSSLTNAIVTYRSRVGCSLGLAKLVVEARKYNHPDTGRNQRKSQ